MIRVGLWSISFTTLMVRWFPEGTILRLLLLSLALLIVVVSAHGGNIIIMRSDNDAEWVRQKGSLYECYTWKGHSVPYSIRHMRLYDNLEGDILNNKIPKWNMEKTEHTDNNIIGDDAWDSEHLINANYNCYWMNRIVLLCMPMVHAILHKHLLIKQYCVCLIVSSIPSFTTRYQSNNAIALFVLCFDISG